MKKSGEMRLKSTICESTRAPLTRSRFPNREGKEEAASPSKREAYPASLRSAALPREGARGEGGERSEPDRVLAG